MRFALKAVSVAVILGLLGVLGIAVFSDLPAPSREVVQPVEAR